MRIMILKCNLNASVKPSTEYLQSFKCRRDVSVLCRGLEKAKAALDCQTWRSLYCKLKCLVEILSRQAVVKMRTEYFKQVN
jgi:hypothetical protein